MTDPTGEKTCSRCGATKRRIDFCLISKKLGTLRPECRICTNARVKARRDQSPEGVEYRRAYAQTYYAAHREQMRAQAVQWMVEHPGYSVKISRAWYLANTERHRANAARWIEQNPERAVENRRGRKARHRANMLAALVIPFTPDQLAARVAYYGGRCWICGGPFEHLDHVKPLSKGGPHILANLRPACARCNLSKNATWPFDPKAVAQCRSSSTPRNSARCLLI